MKQLQYVGDRRLAWAEVPEPELASPAAALVRPVAVASCDLDAAVMDGRAPIPGPYPFGHEFVAGLEVGEQVRHVSAGDLVSVPFQVSCGTCRRCRAGLTGNCEAVAPRASYGLGLLGGLEWEVRCPTSSRSRSPTRWPSRSHLVSSPRRSRA